MERTFSIKKWLMYDMFNNIFNIVIEELSERAKIGEIPVWGSYSVDRVENLYPIKNYYICLHFGPVEDPGNVAATVYIHTSTDSDTAEVKVSW